MTRLDRFPFTYRPTAELVVETLIGRGFPTARLLEGVGENDGTYGIAFTPGGHRALDFEAALHVLEEVIVEPQLVVELATTGIRLVVAEANV